MLLILVILQVLLVPLPVLLLVVLLLLLGSQGGHLINTGEERPEVVTREADDIMTLACHRLATRRSVGARLLRSLVLGVGRVSAIAACAVDVCATVSVARAHARHCDWERSHIIVC